MIPGSVEAIAGGYHGDPFAVLGPHPSGEGDGWVIRTFQPEAVKVEVLASGQSAAAELMHASGFFQASLDREPERYRLRITGKDGGVAEVDDPYRFWPQLTDHDIYLHAQGTNYQAWNSMGAHLTTVDGVAGVRFAVWAPNAESVSVVGEFNAWDARRHPMRRREGAIWEIFLPGIGAGAIYKYFVRSKLFGVSTLKCDPYGFYSEKPPKQGTVIWDLSRYEWRDQDWMEQRPRTRWLEAPVSVYELHLESWMKHPDGQPLSYRELADRLIAYVVRMGYTHIELMPPMEHPYSGSWGYQVVGYFAPTARFGTPDDFKFFIDECHRAGVGVILDWVPAHFPKDAHGLALFDGTACYEHEDPRQGEHKDWGTLIFNYSRNEVKNFVISSALFWLREYHIDGLRVDAVASMIYLNYSRQEGEWVPNKYGGHENLEAIEVLRKFNEEAHQVPGAITIAEESTSFTGVSKPVYAGGLGFTMKWNMGWMHDMFAYFKTDPLYRKFNHGQITFSLLYAFTENFLLPISHDEVVHGKASLLAKMPGNEWERFGNARAFLGYMYAHPGKKLLFMGCEFGQYEEWNWQGSIRWDLLQYPLHRGLHDWVRELNHFYRAQKPLYEVDYHWQGFDWIDFHDIDGSVISFVRRAKDAGDFLVIVCNFTPVVRSGYNVGLPEPGLYECVLCSDETRFGGGGTHIAPRVESRPGQLQGQHHFMSVTLPPLSVSFYRRVAAEW
jgi:1,4-alpha-glucan branching enzyme